MGAPIVTGIMLDKERRLLFRFRDIYDAEPQLGVGLPEVLRRMEVRHLAIMLWAGLRHEDKDLTVPKTLDAMDRALARGTSLVDLWNTVAKGLENSKVLRNQSEEEAAPGSPS